MWQRFTHRARRVVFVAQEEAFRMGDSYVSPEHILLALNREAPNVGTEAIERLGINLDRLNEELENRMPHGDGQMGQDMQLTASSKQVIDLAFDEARQMHNDFIGTEHLLLGIVRDGDSLAAKTLSEMGCGLERLRREVRELQDRRQDAMGVDLSKNRQLAGRDILSILDLTPAEIDLIFSATDLLKAGIPSKRQLELLLGKTLAMIFEKPSLRTRVTFEAGMTQLGGHAIYLSPADAQIGKRETVADAAKNLARWVDGIMARTFSHQTVVDLAEHSSVPVINGLSDLEHPCQALADFYTIKEKKPKLEGLKLAFVGDGNNVCNSLMLLSAKLGVHFAVACPEGYEPDVDLTARARELGAETGATIDIVRDPKDAAKDADALYTDVWASMGQESEIEERKKIFTDYQVNQKLVKLAKDDAIVLHCLPAHRGQEITDEVLDGPHSVVVDEAENRLHVQKALLVLML